jgi:hypothetical protein
VVVKTGDEKGSETKGDVFITLRGKDPAQRLEKFKLTAKDAFSTPKREDAFMVPDRVPMVVRAQQQRLHGPTPVWPGRRRGARCDARTAGLGRLRRGPPCASTW